MVQLRMIRRAGEDNRSEGWLQGGIEVRYVQILTVSEDMRLGSQLGCD